MGDNDRIVWVDPNSLRSAAGEFVMKGRLEGFSTTLSQYDIPEALRLYVAEGDQTVLEFKYIGPDEPELRRNIGSVEARIGKNSGRLYSFKFRANSESAETRLAELRDIAKEMIASPDFSRKTNYSLVDAVLAQSGAELFDWPHVIPEAAPA